MRPSARIAATIELLEILERSNSSAKVIVSSFYRKRRYIGSKDRKDISDRIFNIIRHHARLSWWTNQSSVRIKTAAYLLLIENLSLAEIKSIFDNSQYGPASLSRTEMTLIEKLSNQTIENSNMPEWQENEVPEWLYKELKLKWPKTYLKEIKALNKPASLDIRVNTLKSTREDACDLLRSDNIIAEFTPLSPIGLRINQPVNIYNSRAYKSGLIEIQDEGSQLISLLVGANPNEKTVDLCAGTGGKTLALGATMKNGGPLIACDISSKRLKKLGPRAKRAGISNISMKVLHARNDPWVTASRETCKRVLVDAPCSGTGTWRRSPFSKWQITKTDISKRLKQQLDVLKTAEILVGDRGRIIYATCSLLQKENEDQIKLFLKTNKDFRLLSIDILWQELLGYECPSSGPFLNLSPAIHGTDGFFCAVLEKSLS